MFVYRPVKKIVRCAFNCIHTSYDLYYKVLRNISNTVTLMLMNWEKKKKNNIRLFQTRNQDIFLPIVCYLVIMISFAAAVRSVRGDVFQAGVWRA